jgi:hypothetical protein
VVSTVVRAAKDLLHRALAVDGKTILFLSLELDFRACSSFVNS